MNIVKADAFSNEAAWSWTHFSLLTASAPWNLINRSGPASSAALPMY